MRERLVLILVVLSFSLFVPRTQADQSENPVGDDGQPDPATSFAHLSTDGLIGGVHVVDAKSGAPGTFRIALNGHSFRRDGFVSPHDGHRSNGGRLTLDLVPIDHLELAASVVAYASQNRASDPDVVQVLGDLHFFAKGFVALRPWLWLAGDVELALLNDVGDLGIAGDATSVGLRTSATADLRPLTDLPLLARANLRYRFDNSAKLIVATERARYDSLVDPVPVEDESRHLINPAERYALQINRLDMLSLSLGVELPLTPHERVEVRPMVEWGFGLPINRQGYVCVRPQPGERDACLAAEGFGARPSNLTAGVRVQPYLPGLAVLLAVDVATSGSRTFVRELAPTSRYMLHFGLSYAYDRHAETREPPPFDEPEEEAPRPRARRRQKRSRGHVRGHVVDATTGAPVIEAVVHVEGAEVSDVVTDADGAFRSAELSPGPQSLLVHARGYGETHCAAVVPDDGKDGQARCAITPLDRTGELRGRVMDHDGRSLAGAEVNIEGPAAMRFTSTEDGTFRGEQVPEGSYALRVEAAGHFPVYATARVEAGSIDETPALRLYPRPQQPEVRVRDDRLVLSRPIAFEKKSATLSPSSFSLLAEVADLLITHPEIRRVEVQGHVSSRKSADDDQGLSEDRARAVCDWLTARGVAGERLRPVGYGGSEPLVPNITPNNRAKNSRIELLIR